MLRRRPEQDLVVVQAKRVSRKLRKCNAWPPAPGSEQAAQAQAEQQRRLTAQRNAKVRTAQH